MANHKVYPLQKTKFNRQLAITIEEYIYKFFNVNKSYNFTDALFHPQLYAITMPLNALLLLRIIHPAIQKIYDIHIQIGYTNEIILHHVKFPKAGQAIQLSLSPDKLQISQQDLPKFLTLFPPYTKIVEIC